MSVRELTNRMDSGLAVLSGKYGFLLLEMSIGIIYLWFGALKFFPGYSPAEEIASSTLSALTLSTISGHYLLIVLAIWEITIGIFLLFRIKSRYVIWLLLLHMAGTLSPVFLFPEIVFSRPPFGFSMIGQYIMKNFVIISAALVIYSRR